MALLALPRRWASKPSYKRAPVAPHDQQRRTLSWQETPSGLAASCWQRHLLCRTYPIVSYVPLPSAFLSVLSGLSLIVLSSSDLYGSVGRWVMRLLGCRLEGAEAMDRGFLAAQPEIVLSTAETTLPAPTLLTRRGHSRSACAKLEDWDNGMGEG
jgi:hypothetical protein